MRPLLGHVDPVFNRHFPYCNSKAAILPHRETNPVRNPKFALDVCKIRKNLITEIGGGVVIVMVRLGLSMRVPQGNFAQSVAPCRSYNAEDSQLNDGEMENEYSYRHRLAFGSIIGISLLSALQIATAEGLVFKE